MTAVADPGPVGRSFQIRTGTAGGLAERFAGSPRKEFWAIAIIGTLIYGAAGVYLTVHLGVIPYDSAFRMLHADMVWHNAPPKLAAIGFVWPPLMTIELLPFAFFKGLVTSLWGMPLSSAPGGGLCLAILCTGLARMGMPRLPRIVCVIAFGLNPVVFHYATNGMAEIHVLALLALGLVLFHRWYETRRWHLLAMAGVAFGFGVLTRYELLAYVPILVLFAVLSMSRRGVAHKDAEGGVLLFVVPVIYMMGLWVLYNTVIIGSSFNFLQQEVQQRLVLEKGRTVAEGGAGGHSAALLKTIVDILHLNLLEFAVTLPLVAALVLWYLYRRQSMAILWAVLLMVNAVTTLYLAKKSDLALLEIRFNMRSLPIAVLALGWLVSQPKSLNWRRVGGWVAVACIAASWWPSWHMMETWPYQFADRVFTEAVRTGKNVDSIGEKANRPMTNYIVAHVHRNRAVLVDDAQTFVPILLSGKPGLFYNRADFGDTRWFKAAHAPAKHHVQYLLMPSTQGVIPDNLLKLYPSAPEGKVPFLKPVFRGGGLVLLKVVRPPVQAPAALTSTSPALTGTPARSTPATPPAPAHARSAPAAPTRIRPGTGTP